MKLPLEIDHLYTTRIKDAKGVHVLTCYPNDRERIVSAINGGPALVEALLEYMAQFGQGLEAHGIPYGPAQADADKKAREALALVGVKAGTSR